MNPYFTIIIAVYNAEKYLRETLDSIVAQICTDWECICVDDGSKDTSPRILDEYAACDSRFVIVHKENGGVGRARNVALDRARGDWITWADADDILAPSRLAAAKKILDKENPDFLHLWFTMAKEMPNDFMSIGEDCEYNVVTDLSKIYETCWRHIHPFSMLWLSFARHELYDGLRYPDGMRVKGDSILYANLFPRIKKLCRGNHAGYFYCLTEGSILRGKRKASDCIRFQNESANLWIQQHELAANLGKDALLAMESDLRYSTESDLLDWLTTHTTVTSDVKRAVWESHQQVRKTGVVNQKTRITKRFWLGLLIYNRTGWDGLVRLADRVVRILRSTKKNLIKNHTV